MAHLKSVGLFTAYVPTSHNKSEVLGEIRSQIADYAGGKFRDVTSAGVALGSAR